MDGSLEANGVVLIYGLTDPRTGQLRYVGRTIRHLRARLNGHVASAREANDRHVNCWVRGLLADGMKPEIFLLEEATGVTWEEAERFWIEYWRWVGADLTNLAIGGGGSMGYRHRPEALAAFRKRSGPSHYAWGKTLPPEVHEALAAGRLRYQATHPHPLLGTKRPPETREKISKARKGKPANWSTEGRAAIEEGQRRRWADPAQRSAMSARMSGANNHNFGKIYSQEELDRKAKLTADEVRRLRSLHASGQWKIADLMAEFHISRSHVYNIISGKKRGNVPPVP